MGGGHVSRPDFGMPQPDPNHPLTEFYLALQHALDKEGSFALPALYAGFQAPARRVYADEAAEYLTLSSTAGEGMTRLLAPGHLQLLYSSLHVMPDGAPVALLLTEECTRTVFAKAEYRHGCGRSGRNRHRALGDRRLCPGLLHPRG